MAGEHKIWMVRSGSGGYLIDEFLDNDIIAIGWNDIGRIKKNISYPDLREKFENAYPEDSDGRVNQCMGQIWRFYSEFSIGDKVITYDSSTREYYLGEIVSDYKFSDKYEHHHYREVKWQDAPTERDVLQADTKNRLGSILTIFNLSEEIWEDLLKNNPAYLSEEEIKEIEEVQQKFEQIELERLKNEVISSSQEFIKDIISNLTWQDTEKLVAGLLRVLGYKTRFTSRGSDLGSDIIASPDELGLEDPKIKVEVKKRGKDKISAPDIRNFIGGLRGHHKGIFVTTSGFSKEAIYEAERANFSITLIDSDWLVELIVSNYEKLDQETKALVPLRRIYWPV